MPKENPGQDKIWTERYLLRIVTTHVVCGVTFDEDKNLVRRAPYLGFLKSLGSLEEHISWLRKTTYRFQLIGIK